LPFGIEIGDRYIWLIHICSLSGNICNSRRRRRLLRFPMPNGATLKRILAAGWLLLYYSRLL
jgi:hypothetical protein